MMKIHNELKKIFDKKDEKQYKNNMIDSHYSDIISVFNKKLKAVEGEDLFDLVKFFGWNSNEELLNLYFADPQIVKNKDVFINKADELIIYMNENPEKFTYSVDKAKVIFYEKEWKKTTHISKVWEQMHLFFPAENILSILLYPIYKQDINAFINLWQKIELPFYANYILHECNIQIDDILNKILSEVDVIIEKNVWNKKFSAALLLEYAFTQMFYGQRRFIINGNNKIEEYIESNYNSLIKILCRRTDADFILKNWFIYIVQTWQNLFSEYKVFIPHIISQIIQHIQKSGKNIDTILDLDNVNTEDIQPLLLAKIYSEEEYNFDEKYIQFLFKSYKNKCCVSVYSVPKLGYMRENISYLGQLLVGLKDPVNIWMDEWKKLELSRIQCRYKLDNYDFLNSSLFHILLGLAAFSYLISKDKKIALMLLDELWKALEELYFLNGYVNSVQIETLMLYVIFILIEENIQDKCIEKIKFISDNLQLLIRLINQKTYTNKFTEWFDDNLKQKVRICYQIANLYQGQKTQYIIYNDELIQTLGIKDG